MKGWYSLVQYCPDASRAEVANVGVVLLCPEKGYLDARLASGNDLVRRFFQISGDALEGIALAKESFARRVRAEQGRILSLDALTRFQETRANELLLTAPRAVRVDDPAATLESLFRELVGGRMLGERVVRGQSYSSLRKLRSLFEREEFERLVRPRPDVRIPTLGRPFRADYAYRNGALNLISHVVIRRDEDETIRPAMNRLLEADLLQRHGEAKIVMVLPDPPESLRPQRDKLAELYDEYRVEHLPETDLDAFGRHVLATATAP